MVRIDGSGLNALGTALDGVSGASSAAEKWRREGESRTQADRQAELRTLLLSGLKNRLVRFADTLSRFEWPEDSIRNGLSVDMDPRLDGKVRATVQRGAEMRDYHRLFSRGLEPTEKADLDPGDYVVTLGLGDTSQNLIVTVEDGASNHDVLTALRDAINQSSLPVQAEVVRQTSSGQKIPGLSSIGETLAVAVNGAYAHSDVTLENHTGYLLRPLDMREVVDPVQAPSPKRYDLVAPQTAKPTRYTSNGLDRYAESGLPAGEYAITAAMGDRSADVTVNVAGGDTWEEVTQKLAARLNSSADWLKASTRDENRPYYDPRLPDGMVQRPRRFIDVEAYAPKVGERLRLSEDVTASPDGSTGLLESLGLNVTAQPGTDAKMTINGREYVRAPGTFIEEEGGVRIDLTDDFGEDLGFRTVQGPDLARRQLGEIALAYNELSTFLRSERDLWRPGFADAFAVPVRQREDGLAEMGLTLDSRGNLRFDPTQFGRGVYGRQDGGYSLLAAPGGGLVPVWYSQALGALSGDQSRFLADLSGVRRASPAAALDNGLRSLIVNGLG